MPPARIDAGSAARGNRPSQAEAPVAMPRACRLAARSVLEPAELGPPLVTALRSEAPARLDVHPLALDETAAPLGGWVA